MFDWKLIVDSVLVTVILEICWKYRSKYMWFDSVVNETLFILVTLAPCRNCYWVLTQHFNSCSVYELNCLNIQNSPGTPLTVTSIIRVFCVGNVSFPSHIMGFMQQMAMSIMLLVTMIDKTVIIVFFSIADECQSICNGNPMNGNDNGNAVAMRGSIEDGDYEWW